MKQFIALLLLISLCPYRAKAQSIEEIREAKMRMITKCRLPEYHRWLVIPYSPLYEQKPCGR